MGGRRIPAARMQIGDATIIIHFCSCGNGFGGSAMLTIHGRSHKFCDGLSRRNFLKIGGFAMGGLYGLTLADILRAQDGPGRKLQHKALINIYLPGGPPHQDMWDLKVDAPVEIRGEFQPIPTRVPGIQICELFPRIAAMMDKFTIIRSLTGCEEQHDGYQCTSGWFRDDLSSQGGRPSIGSTVAKLHGEVHRGMPPHIGLGETKYARYSESGSPGFLGPAYNAFKPHPNGTYAGSYAFTKNLSLEDMKLSGITLDRLQDRKGLLGQLDRLRRAVDVNGAIDAADHYTQSAFEVLTSGRLVEALDLSKEDPKVRERYGDGKPFGHKADAAFTVNENILLARRLVEAGARSVTISYGSWDNHGSNFARMRYLGPRLDQVVSTLVDDLDQRGLLDDVTVSAWGEFGRTPRINAGAGRDHWPQVNAALIAGGGMRHGQVIGATNRFGEYAIERPIHMQQVISMLYANLGIDTLATTVNDLTGRPRYLVEHREPIAELS